MVKYFDKFRNNVSKSLLYYAKRMIGIVIILVMFASVVRAAVPNTSEPDDGIETATTQVVNTVFGAEETPIYVNGTLTSGLTKLVNTKSRWVRGPEIVWSDIEAVQGSYDWSKLQPALDELDEIINLNYTPIVIVRGTPSWAQIPNSSTCGPIKADKFDDFGNFIQDVMDKLDDEGKHVQYWEIWNEPDVSQDQVPADYAFQGCWGDPDDEYYGGRYYSKMLSVVYQMMKDKDPSVQVLVGGLNLACMPGSDSPCTEEDQLPAKFFEGILNDGLGSNFDGVSYHAYDGYGGEYGKYGNMWWNSYWNTTGPSLIAKASYLRMLMQYYGVQYKYLMSTETALICDFDYCKDSQEFEATKANYLADAYASAVAYGISANLWFDILGTWGRNNGLVDMETLDNLPAMDAYSHGSEMLEAAQLVRQITEYEGVYGYEFKLYPNNPLYPNYHVWMVRSIDGQSYTIQLVYPPAIVYDVYGNDISDQVTSDYKLDISVEPVYIVMPASVPRTALPLIMKYFKYFGNGDFENQETGWDFINNNLPASLISEHPDNPITGTPDTSIPIDDYGAQLNKFGYECNQYAIPVGNAELQQQFYVPEVPGSVKLEFDYIIYTEDKDYEPDPLAESTYDRFEVYILSASGSTLLFSDSNKTVDWGCNAWKRIPSPSQPRDGVTEGWATGTISLDSYQGESVIVSFQSWNRTDGFYNTVSYVDNVRLVVTP